MPPCPRHTEPPSRLGAAPAEPRWRSRLQPERQLCYNRGRGIEKEGRNGIHGQAVGAMGARLSPMARRVAPVSDRMWQDVGALPGMHLCVLPRGRLMPRFCGGTQYVSRYLNKGDDLHALDR